jgi:phage protein D
MTIYTRTTIGGVTYTDIDNLKIDKSISDFNSTSNFSLDLDNHAGKYSDTFNLGDEVIVYANLNVTPAVTKMFVGVIEDINFSGGELSEKITLSGRDYGCILQDIIVQPRIFTNTEVSDIVEALVYQNAAGLGITTTNVDVTTTTIDKITFNNITLYDSIEKLAEIAGYYFYIDENKDLHFEERNNTSSGQTIGFQKNDVYAHFKLNENAANTTVVDSSIYSHNGVASANTSTFSVEGKIGSGFNFTGSDYVKVNNHWDLTGVDEASVAFWFKLNSTSQNNAFPRIVEKEGGTTRNGWIVNWQSGTVPTMKFATWNGGVQQGANGSMDWDTTNWHHYAGTYKQNDYVRVYIDGVLNKSETATATIGSNSNDLYLGAEDNTPSFGFDGRLDDVRFYKRQLKQTEISSIYNAGNGTEGTVGDEVNNVLSASFKQVDDDIFNKVTVYGDRQLTGAEQVFDAQTGSVYYLDDPPHNVFVIGSSSPNVAIQPGGIINVDDPGEENVKFLVDYSSSAVILTSGTFAGDNTGWTGSVIIIDYQRSSPIISIRTDTASQSTYGRKEKVITDKNIKTLDEANLRANTFLSEHKDAKSQGTVSVYGILNITPGNTVVVNMPFQNINKDTFSVLSASYDFNLENCFSDSVLTLELNKKIPNYIDYAKEIELRLRSLEGADVDTSITNVIVSTGSVTVNSSDFKVISRSIGSSFYFHVPGHDVLNSPTSLLGDMRLGSTVLTS